MPDLSRSQILVYGALAVALLLVGARAIRSEGGAGTSYAAGSEGPSTGGGTSFSVGGGGPDVVVDVGGAVRSPGVYRLPVGSRVTDAVERAGGASSGAELEAINLAARLADGQQVLVPDRKAGGAGHRPPPPKKGRSASAAPASRTSNRSTGSGR